MKRGFPETMDFSGFNAPSHIECDVRDLIVIGEFLRTFKAAGIA